MSTGEKKAAEKLLDLVNKMNKTYAHAKFSYDSNSKTVDVELDTFFMKNEKGAYEDRGARCLEALEYLYYACDNSYPELVRAIWN